MTARKGTFGSKPPGFLGRIASPLLWPLTLRGWSRYSPGLGSWPKRGRGLLATLRDRGLRKVRSRKRAGVSNSPGSFYALWVSENEPFRDCLESARRVFGWPTLRSMESRRYPTDLSDDEWRCISPHLPEPAGQGRPRLHGLRAILDAVFYVLKSGCPWRLLPKDFPPWKSVYDWFRRWRIDGTWKRLNAALRERLRCRLGRDPHPSAGIVDSQSARTTGVGGNERGFDPAKKVEGRKRHLLVDTEGLVLEVRVHSAKVPDEDGIRLLLDPARERLARLSYL